MSHSSSLCYSWHLAVFSLKTGLLFVFLASSAIQICFYLGKVRLFGDAPDRKTISSLYASHVRGLTAPLSKGTVLQERKAELWLCPAATPEKLKPGQRVPCAPGPTSKRAAHVYFVAPKSHWEYWLLWLSPFLIWHLLCPEMEKRCLKAQKGKSQPNTSFKGEANLQCGNEQQHYPASEGSEGEQRSVWDVSLTKGSNVGSSVSSQLFWVIGQIIGTVPEFPPYLPMEE